MPHSGMCGYEQVIELAVVALASCYLAVFMCQYFAFSRRFWMFPQNQGETEMPMPNPLEIKKQSRMRQ